MNMKPFSPIFVTYCSKNKKRDKGLMSAISRYESGRILQVKAAADSLGIPFLMLSGKYGLLAPHERIPWYDHLLKWEGIGRVLPQVARRLAREKVGAVVYFTRPLQASAPLAYHALMEAACVENDIKLISIELERGQNPD